MRIQNDTRYSTAMLRDVVRAAVTRVERVLTANPYLYATACFAIGRCVTVSQRASELRRHGMIRFQYPRGRTGRRVSWADRGGDRSSVSVPAGGVALDDLCWLVQRLVFSLYGVDDRDMPDAVRERSPSAFRAAAEHYGRLLRRYGAEVHDGPTTPSVTASATAAAE